MKLKTNNKFKYIMGTLVIFGAFITIISTATAFLSGQATQKANKFSVAGNYSVIYDANTGSIKEGCKAVEPQTDIKWFNEDNTDKMYVRANGYDKDNSRYEFAKPGHHFVGWSLTPNGDVEYQVGSKHEDNRDSYKVKENNTWRPVKMGDTVKLYAVWEPNEVSKEGYYLVTGHSSDGGKSNFKHEEIKDDLSITVGTTDSEGPEGEKRSNGESYSGIYYIGDTVEWNKQITPGQEGGVFTYGKSGSGSGSYPAYSD